MSLDRRQAVQVGLAATLGGSLFADLKQDKLNAAVEVLDQAVKTKQVSAAVLHVQHGEARFSKAFGLARDEHAMFLLGSISKPICITALMVLFDQGLYQLADPVKKYLPRFTGDGRDRVTIQHLLTHTCGLPDQLPNNNALRKKHAKLGEFVDEAIRTPLLFPAGSKYSYSSMGILLATHIAEVLTRKSILDLVQATVFQPLKMQHSAQGLGVFPLKDFVPVQTEKAAPESGAGDPTAKDWDWNSPYWRGLGAPWGGTHASAGDVASFLSEFLHERGQVVKPSTAKLMTTNQNGMGLTPRGLGFNVGANSGSKGCSEQTFGHTGSTGTLAWADRTSKTIAVILTSLPGGAVQPHPREQAGDLLS